MNVEPTPKKVFKTPGDIAKAWSEKEANFRGAIFECPADFSNETFNSHADFTGAEFKGKVDFTGVVFKDGVSFKDARFLTMGEDVLFDDAVFKPSSKDVTFAKAKFGLQYQRVFGDWEIIFERKEDGLGLLRRKKNQKQFFLKMLEVL